MCNKEDFDKIIEHKRKIIRDRPISSIAIASSVGVGIGILAGLLIWRRK